ncbi:MAG: HTH-type transcriptional regulator CysB, partial [Steroidobacteraceae bacterium]|nr:HTH-type transcriptional regulator CysB [Steroidobacteraceae bacterium]
QLAAHPIITYVFSFAGPSSLQDIFVRDGLVPNVALTARDADVIKTYVRMGLGVGIVASMSIDPKEDTDLVEIDTSHLFPAHTTWIGFRRGGLLRRYQLDFMQLFAPHLTRRLIERAAQAATQADVDALTAGLALPLK